MVFLSFWCQLSYYQTAVYPINIVTEDVFYTGIEFIEEAWAAKKQDFEEKQRDPQGYIA